MRLARHITEIAERLMPADRPEASAALFIALLRELAKGRPVSRFTLAKSLGWTAERVVAMLERATSIEYDHDGNIVGYGLTLRETPHIFSIAGSRLYTWCALDALIVPVLIGRVARVSSRCAATGAPISLTVAPNEIGDVEQADMAVSLLLALATADIRQSFCRHVHFFASVRAGEDWASKHKRVEIVSVQDAFDLGRVLARHLLRAAQSKADDPLAAGIASADETSVALNPPVDENRLRYTPSSGLKWKGRSRRESR